MNFRCICAVLLFAYAVYARQVQRSKLNILLESETSPDETTTNVDDIQKEDFHIHSEKRYNQYVSSRRDGSTDWTPNEDPSEAETENDDQRMGVRRKVEKPKVVFETLFPQFSSNNKIVKDMTTTPVPIYE